MPVGCAVGPDVVGRNVGDALGVEVVGLMVGFAVGTAVGLEVGLAVGSVVGLVVGSVVGGTVGASVGAGVGEDDEGVVVGPAVGIDVGEQVAAQHVVSQIPTSTWPSLLIKPRFSGSQHSPTSRIDAQTSSGKISPVSRGQRHGPDPNAGDGASTAATSSSGQVAAPAILLLPVPVICYGTCRAGEAV